MMLHATPAAPTSTRRLPDFFVLGPGKCGTTSLHHWLSLHPSVHLPADHKEIHFFSHEATWQRGLDWYAGLFTSARPGEAVGDCTIHAHPDAHPDTARRIADACPQARLVFLVRDPVERLRSHYRHEVQRGRETRQFATAVERNAVYVETSLYSRLAEPFDRAFAAEQLLCIQLRTLTTDAGWAKLQAHIRVPPVPRPTSVLNATASKPGYAPAMRWLWDRGLVPSRVRGPAIVRSVARRLLLRAPTDAHYRALLASSEEDALPPHLLERVLEDHTTFRADHDIH